MKTKQSLIPTDFEVAFRTVMNKVVEDNDSIADTKVAHNNAWVKAVLDLKWVDSRAKAQLLVDKLFELCVQGVADGVLVVRNPDGTSNQELNTLAKKAADTSTSITGEQVGWIREELGLTQQWLADQSGITTRTLQTLEKSPLACTNDKVLAVLSKAEEKFDDQIDRLCTHLLGLRGLAKTTSIVYYAADEDFWFHHPDFAPYPAYFHKRICQEAMREFKSIQKGEGKKNAMQFKLKKMRTPEYLAWLGDRENTGETRAQWVVSN